MAIASTRAWPWEERISLEQALVDLRSLDLDLLLAGLLLQLLHRGDELLDLAVGDVERVEDLGLGDALGAGLDHQDRLVGAGDDQVEVELLVALLGRVDDEVALELADPDRADVLGDREPGRSPAPRRRRSSRGCRRGGRGRPTSASRPAGSRSASPWGRAGGSAGRSCARSASPSRRICPRDGRTSRGSCPRRTSRSSTSTVRGRKSTSRRLPTVAVQRTIVSPA